MNSAKDPDKILKWTAVYLGAVSCLLVPLFIRNSYFGLIELKARVYLYAAVPAVVLMAVPVLHGLLAGGKKIQEDDHSSYRDRSMGALFFPGVA